MEDQWFARSLVTTMTFNYTIHYKELIWEYPNCRYVTISLDLVLIWSLWSLFSDALDLESLRIDNIHPTKSKVGVRSNPGFSTSFL